MPRRRAASRSTTRRRPLARINADRPLAGASTQKLLVAAAALAVLGPTTLRDPRGQRRLRGERRARRRPHRRRRRRSRAHDRNRPRARPPTRLSDLADAIVAAGITGSTARSSPTTAATTANAPLPTGRRATIAEGDIGALGALVVNGGYARRRHAAADPALDTVQQLARSARGARRRRSRGVRHDRDARADRRARDRARRVAAARRRSSSEMLTDSNNETAELLTRELGVAAAATAPPRPGTQRSATCSRISAFRSRASTSTTDRASRRPTGSRAPRCWASSRSARRAPLAASLDGLAVAGRTGTLALPVRRHSARRPPARQDRAHHRRGRAGRRDRRDRERRAPLRVPRQRRLLDRRGRTAAGRDRGRDRRVPRRAVAGRARPGTAAIGLLTSSSDRTSTGCIRVDAPRRDSDRPNGMETSGRQPAARRARAEGPRRRVRQAGDDRPAQGPRPLRRLRPRRRAAHGHRRRLPRDRPAARACRATAAGPFTATGRGCLRHRRRRCCVAVAALVWMARAKRPRRTRGARSHERKPVAAPDRKITRDDIEAKLREIHGEVDRARPRPRKVPAIAVAVGVVVVTSPPRTCSAAARASGARPCSRSGASDVRDAAPHALRPPACAAADPGSRAWLVIAVARRRASRCSATSPATTTTSSTAPRCMPGDRFEIIATPPKKRRRKRSRGPERAPPVLLAQPHEGAAAQPAPRARGSGAEHGRAAAARARRRPESVLVIRDDELVTHDARLADDDVVEIRPVISGGAAMKCRRCREPAVIDVRRHNAAFCADCFLHHCREQVRRAIDDSRHDRAGRAGARRGVGRQGLARAVGPPARARLRGRRPLPRARHRRVLRRVGRVRARVRERARLAAARGRPARRRTASTSPTARAPPRACAVRRVRTVEAPPVQRGRARPRLRRRRHRPQPRRRGRGAARQRAALGGRATSAASTRCCRRRPASSAR